MKPKILVSRKISDLAEEKLQKEFEVTLNQKDEPKKTAAINLPNNPRFANPVGRAMNNVPTVEPLTFNPKLITIGNVINPASKPTAVSREATLKASLGR